MKMPVSAITFEPKVVETSSWLQNVPDGNIYQDYPVIVMFDVPLLCLMTSNNTYHFSTFCKFINFVPIDLKIGTNIDCTYTMYHKTKTH